jgi:hypothetical protein
MKRMHCDACRTTAELDSNRAPKGWRHLVAYEDRSVWQKDLCPRCFVKVRKLFRQGAKTKRKKA